MAVGDVCFLSGVILLAVIVNVCSHPTQPGDVYFMTEMCGGEVDMVAGNFTWGRLRLNRKQSTYSDSMDCWVHIRAPARRSLMVRLQRMHIPQLNDCDDDFVQIFDGSKDENSFWLQNRCYPEILQLPPAALSSKLCGETAPDKHFHSSSRNISVHMRSETVDEHRDFHLMFTAYHTGPCEVSEFTCNNGHCIDGSLYCNDYDNCGDGSDECRDHVVTVVVVLAVITVVIIVIGVVIFILRRRLRRNNAQSTTAASKLEFEKVKQDEDQEDDKKEGSK